MHKKIGILILLLTIAIQIYAQNINYAEYFIDNDPGYGNANSVTVTAGADITVDFTADLSATPNGFHVLYVRARDDLGNWSQVFTRQFTKWTNDVSLSDINKLEYFIDTDPGFGLATDVPISAGVEQDVSFVADLTNLSNGFHVLYIRARDDLGNWSQVFTRQFTKFSDDLNLPDITEVEYFIDSDPGYGLATGVPIVAGEEKNISFIADLTAFSNGFHVLYVRAKDEEGNWSQVFTRQFTKFTDELNVPDITDVEYFIDADPGFGLATEVPIVTGAEQDISFVADLTNVANGFHVIYVRAKDAEGNWSQVFTRQFTKFTDDINLPDITKVEYFIDTDPGYGSATDVPITTGAEQDISFTADLSSITDGFHVLYVRAKDAEGNWSQVFTRQFTKFQGGTGIPDITKVEYFIDADPGYGSATDVPITAGAEQDISFAADLTGVSKGFHILYLRVQDANDNWSQVMTRQFVKTPAISNVVDLEYFVDTDPGFDNGITVAVSSPATDVSQDYVLDLSPYSLGMHDLYVRGKDAAGNWSMLYYQSFEKLAAIVATASPANGGTITGAGDYHDGETADLLASTATGYDFVNWTEGGTEISTNASYSFTVDADRALTANFALQTFDISASAMPAEGGTISGAGVHTYGTTAELIANPATGYDFINWTEEGVEVSTNTTYSFTVDGARTLVANFELQTFDISANANPAESGTISGAGEHAYGTTAELIASPATGYNFVNWTEGGVEVSTNATYSFTVDADRNLVANFELQTFDISASANPAESGTISGTGVHTYGTTAELIASPATGYNFVNWTEDGTEVSTDVTYSFTVDAGRTLVANFELQTFDISASANPVESGTISGTGVHTYGTTAELISAPATGYDFITWTEGSIEVSTNATYSFTVDADRDLVANFELQTFDIAASANPSEGGTIAGAAIYDYGTSAALIATAETGYKFENWTESGVEVSTDANYTFIVETSRTFVANFKNITSINELENKASFVLFPNPASDVINIRSENFSPKANQKIKIRLVDHLGKISKVKTISVNPGLIQVNVANRTAGTYYLQIIINNELTETFKVIIAD